MLACFGGAGAQHACAIARALGISTIFVHRYAGVLSAVGIHLADVVSEAQEPFAGRLDGDGTAAAVDERLAALEATAKARLHDQVGGFCPALPKGVWGTCHTCYMLHVGKRALTYCRIACPC